VIDPVRAAIRRRIRIPLRFADGCSTSATVVSFAGLEPQLREAVERMAKHGGYVLYLCQEGVPTALHLTGSNAAYLATKARRGGHDLRSRSLEHPAEPRRDAGPLPGPAGPGFEAR
jgi:GTP cyclohydrolase II